LGSRFANRLTLERADSWLMESPL